MSTAALLSVVIACFNYERFVGDAVRSALTQEGEEVEVIVVDDGSRDHSREVVAGFGDHVRLIAKDNGGQASALNRGYAGSRGDAVVFLDADDVLLPSAARAVLDALMHSAGVAKAHWSMPIIDADGELTGEIQDPELAEGDLYRHVLDCGPLSDMTMPNPPMSGNAFSRSFLEQVMPIPEELYRIAADEYLFGLAPAYGEIKRLAPQSLYRIHGGNDHTTWSFERSLRFQEQHATVVLDGAARAVRARGDSPDEQTWKRATWWLRVNRVVEAIDSTLPNGDALALIDGGALGIGNSLRGRPVRHFPEFEGSFNGAPADDEEALAELERVERGGVRFLALAWPAFWWRDEYPGLLSAIEQRYRLVVDDEHVQLFAGGS